VEIKGCESWSWPSYWPGAGEEDGEDRNVDPKDGGVRFFFFFFFLFLLVCRCELADRELSRPAWRGSSTSLRYLGEQAGGLGPPMPCRTADSSLPEARRSRKSGKFRDRVFPGGGDPFVDMELGCSPPPGGGPGRSG